MIWHTYACRAGKGAHAALRYAQAQLRRFPYYLQCDIQQYFASIRQDLLRELLRRVLKDSAVLRLLDRIIVQDVPGSASGRGLPIGNLTSQYFANLYLGELDHYLLERVGVSGYVRYMDDFVVFDKTKEALRETLSAARDFVGQRLALGLKERSVRLAPAHTGLSFLGCRVFPGTIRLQAEKWQRFRRRWRATEEAFQRGGLDENAWQRSAHSRLGHLLHADTLALRRKFFEGREPFKSVP